MLVNDKLSYPRSLSEGLTQNVFCLRHKLHWYKTKELRCSLNSVQVFRCSLNTVQGLDCECWQCMALVEESESVKMVKGLEAGIDITEKVLRVARRHVTELLDPEVREGGRDGLHHHLGPQHLCLQAAGRVDLAVEVHLVEGWRPGVGCWGQDVVGVDLGRLGAGQVVPLGLVAVELGLGLVVRGLVDKVGLDQAQVGFHILPR